MIGDFGDELGWKLAGVVRGDYRRELLDTYSAERQPVAKALIAGTDRSYRGVLHPSELQQRLVRMFGPFIVKTQMAQTTMATILEELNIAYDASPLNNDLEGAAGPKPGHRAPVDAPVVRGPDRETVLLADVTRTIEWALLVFAVMRSTEPPHGSSEMPNTSRYQAVKAFGFLLTTKMLRFGWRGGALLRARPCNRECRATTLGPNSSSRALRNRQGLRYARCPRPTDSAG